MRQPSHHFYQQTFPYEHVATEHRRRNTAAVLAQSAHQKRATEVLNVFDAEITKVGGSKVASFLLHYTCCDALALLLIGSRKQIPPHAIFGNKNQGVVGTLNVRALNAALRKFKIPTDQTKLAQVFASKTTAGNRSCRDLRNAIIHGLNQSHVVEVNQRFNALRGSMEHFIESVRSRSAHGSIF